MIAGSNNFSAKSINITGHNKNTNVDSDVLGVGLVFDLNSTSAFNGETNIKGLGSAIGIAFWGTTNLTFNGTAASIAGQTLGNRVSDKNDYYNVGAISSNTLSNANGKFPSVLNITLNHTALNIVANATSTKTGKNPGLAINVDFDTHISGINLNGNGSVNILGESVNDSGVDTRLFNNKNLEGYVNISGHSETGYGVIYGAPKNPIDVSLVNTSIHGESNSGIGVVVNNQYGMVNLGNNTITGTTTSGLAGRC
ncbi:hypothetical protein PHA77_17025 (plasmid) [Edwardsiella tarda]|uniref:hypothetical protein n=1 Tax=Edwardsiella tarda TaxID=636 RepID=UPI002444D13D|nr:hypothetical protein [Edwardsiella tarda]WGE30832.1 hypothetical protein PHA77_17025 [Edwardsiella tarda]